MSRTWIDLAYLVAAICLIVGIKRLSHPRTARSGNWIAGAGMTIAVAFTFLIKEIDTYWLMLSGIAVGSVVGIASARMVRMTAIPQMVALFNGVGGGAAALIAAAEFHRLAPLGGQLEGDHLVGILFSAFVGLRQLLGQPRGVRKASGPRPGPSRSSSRHRTSINAVLGSALVVADRADRDDRERRLARDAHGRAHWRSASSSCFRSAARTCRS